MEPIVVVSLLAVGLAAVCVAQALKNGRRASSEEKVMRGYFLLGLSGVMAKLADADGHVTNDEIEMAQRFFCRMGLSEAERATCVGHFLMSRRDGLTVRDHVKRFIASANGAACLCLYDMLWRIARVDGKVDPAEDQLLKEIALDLGLTERNYESFRHGEKVQYDRDALLKAGVPATFVGQV